MATATPQPARSSAQQFISASIALATDLTALGQKVDDLAANKQGSEKGIKFWQLVISILAFVISVVSLAATIYFAMQKASVDRGKETTDAIKLMQEIANLRRVDSSPGSNQSTSYLLNSTNQSQYNGDINALQPYIDSHHFRDIDARNFTALMLTVLSFHDTEHAESLWPDSQNLIHVNLQDRVQLALEYSNYAQLRKTQPEISTAIQKLKDVESKVGSDPRQRYSVEYALGNMNCLLNPPTISSVGGANDEAGEARKSLDQIKTSDPAYAAPLERQTSDLESSVTALRSFFEAEEKTRISRKKRSGNSTAQDPRSNTSASRGQQFPPADK